MLQCLAAVVPLAPGAYGMFDPTSLEALAMSQTEKCLFSHFASAPPWHLHVSIFKACPSLYGSPGQVCLSL